MGSTSRIRATGSTHAKPGEPAAGRNGAPWSDATFRSLLDAAPDAMLVVNAEGEIVIGNRQAVGMFGYAHEQLIGKRVEDLIPQRLRAGHAGHRANFFMAPGVRPMGIGLELTALRADGAEFPVEISLGPIETAAGTLVTAAIRDVGERRRIEARLRELDADLQRRTAERKLEDQLRQAQKMEAIGQLASGVAHDFNNVLCAILGYSDLLLEDTSLNWHARGRVTEIKTAATRAAEITSQMLAFSRKQVLQPRPLDLNAVVKESNKMLRRLIGEDIRLIANLHSDLWTVKADPTQLHQVIVNLAVNARDAMPEGGKLTIDTENVQIDESYSDSHIEVHPGDYVLLAVTDTGTGMDAETQKRIFEPFFTTKRGRGTGLGLSTVYGIVKQSSGYVWVYSEPGHGTTFKIYLPRVAGQPVPLAASDIHSSPHRGSETVLLVEDDAALRELNREQLKAIGYSVLAAANGEAALALAGQHCGEIHLLMTDVVMPGMNGRQLAERLQEVRPDVRVLYVSGYTENVIQQEILSSGVAFLQKPFARDILSRKLRDLLDVRG